MTDTRAPALEQLRKEITTPDFGVNINFLRLKFGEKQFDQYDVTTCPDASLAARYPEIYNANHGDFHLGIQIAGATRPDFFSYEGKELKVNARAWLYNNEKTATTCYFLAEDGRWYLANSNQSPDVTKGINYWKLDAARMAEKADLEMLKGHINSLSAKEKNA